MSAHRNNIWTPSYLPRFISTGEFPLLRRWYRFTAPQEPPHAIGLRAQEILRRARLLSSIVLAEIVLLLIAAVVAILSGQYSIAGFLVVVSGMLYLALRLNRQGKDRIASVLVVVISELSIIITLTLEAWFFNNATMSNFGLSYLLIPEIIAALLLPMSAVLLLLVAHGIFASCLVFLLPQNTVLTTPMELGVVFSTLGVSVLVVSIAVLWRRNMAFLIAHADGIEVVAALEHAMAEQEHTTAQHKRELDLSIDRLMQTHLRVANGEYDARMSMNEEDVLWPIAGSLNTLLARIQRLGRQAKRLEKTEQEAAQLAAALRALRTGGAPVPLQRTGTAIDLILIELSTSIEGPARPTVSYPEAPLSVQTRQHAGNNKES